MLELNQKEIDKLHSIEFYRKKFFIIFFPKAEGNTKL